MDTNNSRSATEHITAMQKTIEGLIAQKQDFSAFVLIALGIEFLGSFFDAADFAEHGHSETRFHNGLSMFKNNWYNNNKDFLYKNFRGPLVHQFWTGDGCYLTSICNHSTPVTEHLQKRDGKVVLVLEKLFEDFSAACEKLLKTTQRQNSLNKAKLNQRYAQIVIVKAPDGKVYSSSGLTTTEKTVIHTA